MLARGKLGDNATVFAVNIDLRGDDAREYFAAVGDNGCCGFVAGRLNAENSNGHSFMLAHGKSVTPRWRMHAANVFWRNRLKKSPTSWNLSA